MVPLLWFRLRTRPRNSAYKERFAIRIRHQKQTGKRKDKQGKAPIIVRY